MFESFQQSFSFLSTPRMPCTGGESTQPGVQVCIRSPQAQLNPHCCQQTFTWPSSVTPPTSTTASPTTLLQPQPLEDGLALLHSETWRDEAWIFSAFNSDTNKAIYCHLFSSRLWRGHSKTIPLTRALDLSPYRLHQDGTDTLSHWLFSSLYFQTSLRT